MKQLKNDILDKFGIFIEIQFMKKQKFKFLNKPLNEKIQKFENSNS